MSRDPCLSGRGYAWPPAGWIVWRRAAGLGTVPLRAAWIHGALLDELVAVQLEVNRSIKFARDRDQHDQDDVWLVPAAGEAGDCEDYALAKRGRLLELGWPAGALRIATCYAETGEYHAVLTVETTVGTYVLDNRVAGIARVDQWPLAYRWDRRERPDRIAWEHVS